MQSRGGDWPLAPSLLFVSYLTLAKSYVFSELEFFLLRVENNTYFTFLWVLGGFFSDLKSECSGSQE